MQELKFTKKISFILLFLFFPVILSASASNKKNIPENQPRFIKKIIKKEKNIKHIKNIYNIIKYIDITYKNLYQKLTNNKKLIIFMDPAHGKLKNGKWQGAVTWRKSCTGRPEEYYSILLSREFYKLINQNPFLEIKTTPDFLQVLKSNSNTYKNIPFSQTIRLAKKYGAFIIISEHLNNISPRLKSGGLISIPGIHITCTKFGRPILTDIKSIHNGFLTLYNRLDASGLSFNYAQELKLALLKEGLSPTSWGKGTVADDRFTYFTNYPISVIYESAFISNPDEEKKLRTDAKYRENLVLAQYNSLISSINNIFGIDISQSKVQKTSVNIKIINQLKLSRILIYYIQQADIKKSFNLSRLFIKKYRNHIDPPTVKAYKEIKKILSNTKKYLNLAQKNKKRKRYKKSARYFKRALKDTWNNPLFYSINRLIYKKYKKIARHLPRRYRIKTRRNYRQTSFERALPIYPKLKLYTEKHKIATPFILTINNDQSLKEAIETSLAPKGSLRKKVYKAFKNVKIKKYKLVRHYSKKRKRYYWKRHRRYKKISFKKGIYIVKFNRKFKIVNVKKVHSVAFDSTRYQNQQYFKNSCLAEKIKKRTL